MSTMKCVLFFALCLVSVIAGEMPKDQPLSAGFRMMKRIYNHCEKSEQIIKCLKEQAVRVTDRAMKLQTIPVIDGITVVKRKDIDEARSMTKYQYLNDEQIRSMSSEELDDALAEKAARFMSTHQMSLTMSSLFGNSGDGQSVSRMIEEGRGKLKKYIGPLLTAIAIKGGFVAMAFQVIAMIAGKALLIGKIALVLSAIIGLKKLVSSGEAHEKTTYEIVKHPQVSNSHTYSSQHYGGGGSAGEFETSGSGGHYRRSIDDDLMAQERAYRSQIPRS